MDDLKPKIPTLKDAKSTKPDFKIKGLSALSFMDRLKQFKKKDMAFILSGLGVLFMAPLVEHFMMSPESDNPAAFKEGFGTRDSANGIGRGGSPYEGGYNGLAPGGLLGSGADVITPLNVRDPSALVMGPGSSQPTPVSAPKPSEPTPPSKSDWKDALANAGSRSAKEVVKSASLPVPKIPLQGGLRGLGVLGGGGGGGSYSLPAISAANVPNSAAGSKSLSSVSAPGFKGLASRGPNVGGSGGMEGLKKAAGNAGGEFNRGGSAAGNLENAAATAMGSGSDSSGGGAGAGGASAGEKGSSQNSNLGSRNQGESLEFLMKKQRMEKELDMYYKKLEKKDWELFGYDLGHKMIETLITKGLAEPLATCLGGMFGGDGEKNCSWYAPKTQGMVICTKGPTGSGGKFSKKQKFCSTPQGYLGTMEGSGAKDSKDVCKRIDSGPDAGYSGCSEHQVADDGSAGKEPDKKTRVAAEEKSKGDEQPKGEDVQPAKPIVDKAAAAAICEKLDKLAAQGNLGTVTASDGSKARGAEGTEANVMKVAKEYQGMFGRAVAAGEAMSTTGTRGESCKGAGGGILLPGKDSSVHDRLATTAKFLRDDSTGGLPIMRKEATDKTLAALSNVAREFDAQDEAIVSSLAKMGPLPAVLETSKKKLDGLAEKIEACLLKEKASKPCEGGGDGAAVPTSASLKQEWKTEYDDTWIVKYKEWSTERENAIKAAKVMAEAGGADTLKEQLTQSDTGLVKSKVQFSAVLPDLKALGGYQPGDATFEPKSESDLFKISEAMKAAAGGKPTPGSPFPTEGPVLDAINAADAALKSQNQANETKYKQLLDRFQSQAKVVEKSYGKSTTGGSSSDAESTYADPSLVGSQYKFNDATGKIARGSVKEAAGKPESVEFNKNALKVTGKDEGKIPSVSYFGSAAQQAFEKMVGEKETAPPKAATYDSDKGKYNTGTENAQKTEGVRKYYQDSNGKVDAQLKAVYKQGSATPPGVKAQIVETEKEFK